jgi:Xaa-Pro aminopeptidase
MRFSYYQKCFDAAEFIARHEKIYEAIGTKAVAVVQGGGPVAGFETFRQTNDFFYLSGVEVPQAYLLLDGRNKTTILYLPHGDEQLADMEGREPCAEDREELMALTGCSDVRPLECLEKDLQGVNILYTPLAPAEGVFACQDTLRHQAQVNARDPWVNHQSREAYFSARLQERIPDVEIRDFSPILFGFRMYKSPAELKVMRRTGQLSALGIMEAMKQTRPGRHR